MKGQGDLTEQAELVVRTYLGSDHPEHFISFETPDLKTIFGFARLRLAPTAGAVGAPQLNFMKIPFTEIIMGA